MKYLESYRELNKSALKIVCDKSCFSIISAYMNYKSKNHPDVGSIIYDREGNSSIISTIKTLISKGDNNILVILDDTGELKKRMDRRLNFLRDFMGKDDYEKLDIKMASEIKSYLSYKKIDIKK